MDIDDADFKIWALPDAPLSRTNRRVPQMNDDSSLYNSFHFKFSEGQLHGRQG